MRIEISDTDDVIHNIKNRDTKIDIFIGWSGEQSRLIAEILKDWIPNVIQNVRPWMSTEDIYIGGRWFNEISGTLERFKFGIFCLTKENQKNPWMHYEAGALSKNTRDSSICPYIIDIKPESLLLFSPFGQFQACPSTKEGTLKLIKSINHALDKDGLTDIQIVDAFNRWWLDLENKLKDIVLKTDFGHPYIEFLQYKDEPTKEDEKHNKMWHHIKIKSKEPINVYLQCIAKVDFLDKTTKNPLGPQITAHWANQPVPGYGKDFDASKIPMCQRIDIGSREEMVDVLLKFEGEKQCYIADPWIVYRYPDKEERWEDIKLDAEEVLMRVEIECINLEKKEITEYLLKNIGNKKDDIKIEKL